MRKPDYNKMRRMLGKGYENLNDNDTMYEFLKSYESYEIPKIDITDDSDKIIRKQISITKGELEVLETWEELPNNTYEDAIVNGIVNQIKEEK